MSNTAGSNVPALMPLVARRNSNEYGLVGSNFGIRPAAFPTKVAKSSLNLLAVVAVRFNAPLKVVRLQPGLPPAAPVGLLIMNAVFPPPLQVRSPVISVLPGAAVRAKYPTT